MENPMLDNKWAHGKVHFELPELPPLLVATPGIKPLAAVLDNHIGVEIVLLITEPEYKVKEFAGRDITRFVLNAGLVYTTHGPVCFLLYSFPDPLSGEQVIYESTINPLDHRQLSIYRQLSGQKYWHVFTADNSGNVVNFFEFPNEYGLKKTLDQIEGVCKNMQATDFMAAKAEYERKCSIEQLLAMSES